MTADTLPILYSFRRCPYAMRARLALLVSGTACVLREVKLSAKPDALREASPKATVPVVVTPAGEVIDESRDIMVWALRRADPQGWLASADDPLIAANDGPFKHALDRYKHPNRYDCDPEEHRAAGLALLQVLEERLARQPQLGGEAMGMVDAAIFPFVRQFAHTDRDWFAAQDLPQVQQWLAGHKESELFARAMVKHAPWAGGDPVALFPAS
ncbi:glutathione S-transferase [Aurantiacibacter xanthus]|uniref:Glutathione S-transferase n=1 Tax=Aurantiacibacter xanthus TaxID=1784712 RepID=A0A3A1PD22_9SPHN|nr:glutathione S-transferase [Aurantiacibacter xanthus]RIV91430.1 glutathione S-transferase [Aurantiacibacter xanthus]